MKYIVKKNSEVKENEWFGNKKWFKNILKGPLDKLVNKLQSSGVEDTPYEDKKWK